MEKLMDVMIDECRGVCNKALAELVSKLNDIAELYLHVNEPAAAVEHYRTVLELIEKYNDKKLEIDICQKIRAMYNLSTVLDENTTLNRALNDSDLKRDVELLEKEYLDASKQNIESTHRTVKFYSDKVANILGNKTLRYSEWWSDILDWIISPNDFLADVQTELEDYCVPGVPNIAKRLKSVNDVHNTLSVWLDDLHTARISTISKLKALEDASMSDLVQRALMCHLSLRIRKRRCFLCNAETQLVIYGSLLFSASNKQMYDSTSKCLLKMSQKEFLLINAAEHIKVLELVREEFRYLKFLYTHTRDSVYAHEKIGVAKSRRTNKFRCIPLVDLKFGEITITTAYLEKKVGILLYLENLKKEKENSTEVDTCPICCLNGDTGWAFFECGHSVCNQCLETMCNHSDTFKVDCPMCRISTPINCISYVKNNQEGAGSNIVIKGSFSTKIECVTLKLMELISQDPNVKVLIFSNWDKALNLLGEALDQNSISYRILKTGTKYKKTLKDFKVCKKLR
ncbi:E3 ubiquitin-protein ligase SHPRH-like [Acyrthosiphon pisum]|uniref:RING-type domain-containing protein n=1 Tax=Acyrthosiphon pisum TaxID=7029 RepID=A0A8R2NK56_ACYPI|nr:E3 ubiquitin-protein ligase SHPRH-like [Acyrthosiphon pisum]